MRRPEPIAGCVAGGHGRGGRTGAKTMAWGGYANRIRRSMRGPCLRCQRASQLPCRCRGIDSRSSGYHPHTVPPLCPLSPLLYPSSSPPSALPPLSVHPPHIVLISLSMRAASTYCLSLTFSSFYVFTTAVPAPLPVRLILLYCPALAGSGSSASAAAAGEDSCVSFGGTRVETSIIASWMEKARVWVGRFMPLPPTGSHLISPHPPLHAWRVP